MDDTVQHYLKILFLKSLGIIGSAAGCNVECNVVSTAAALPMIRLDGAAHEQLGIDCFGLRGTAMNWHSAA